MSGREPSAAGSARLLLFAPLSTLENPAPCIEGLARSEWPIADRVHESTTDAWNAPDASVHAQEHFAIQYSSVSALKNAFTDAGRFTIMLARACERLAPATSAAPHDFGGTHGASNAPEHNQIFHRMRSSPFGKLHVSLCKSQSAWRWRTRLASSMVRHRRVFCPCLRNRIRQSGSACGTSGTCLSVRIGYAVCHLVHVNVDRSSDVTSKSVGLLSMSLTLAVCHVTLDSQNNDKAHTPPRRTPTRC